MLGIMKELNVQYVLGYTPEEFAASLRLIAEGQVDAAAMVTAEVGIDGVAKAFADLANPEAHTKIIVQPWKEGTAEARHRRIFARHRHGRSGRSRPGGRRPPDGIGQHQAEGGEIAVLDRSVVVTGQRFAQDVVGLALHGVELFERLRSAHAGDRGEQPVAMQRCSACARRAEVMPQPCRHRAEAENSSTTPQM